MHHLAVNWWNSNGQQSPQTSSQNNTSNVESPKQVYHVSKQLGLQLSDDSSSSQSFGPPHRELGGKNGQSSQDHCFSADPSVNSGQNERHGKDEEPQMKPVFFLSNPDLGNNPPIVDYVPSMDHFPYHYADPCFGGLFTGYGPQAIIQLPVNSQMVGISPARVPLPADVAENGPIYVNAKQYHGIIRRRQLRAKLEAQNKLIKNRKPYLHESRHLHALNRVRGSGGRFVSTKKVQPNSAPATSSQCHTSHLHLDNFSILSSGTHHSGPAQFVVPNATGLDIGNIPKSDAIFQQLDGRFSSISSSHSGGVLQCNGDQMCSATHHSASIVQ